MSILYMVVVIVVTAVVTLAGWSLQAAYFRLARPKLMDWLGL